MKNTISQRVADFLKNFPPFNFLDKFDIEVLSEQVSIIYKDKGAIVFEENEETHNCFYVVHKGAIELSQKSKNDILDMCDEGDIFGLRPLIAHENYKMQACAHEESILYAIPIDVFKPYAIKNSNVGSFIIDSFASNTHNPYSKSHTKKLYGDSLEDENMEAEIIDKDNKILDLQPIKYSKKIITCSRAATAKEIALTMTKKNIGAMLVVEDMLPIGIITDKDLRNKIVTGDYSINTTADVIMNSPVITYSKK